MNSYFDGEAATYDSSFTYSSIGRLQRTQVWKYLDQVLPELKGNEILEINCGTGEDAIHLGSKGCHVLATDSSTQMLEIAKSKALHNNASNVIFQQLNLTNIDCLPSKKFDLVFSNFGGLNCIDPESIVKLAGDVSKVLKNNGRFIAVIMPRFCLWEFCYFMLKFNGSKATRRLRKNSAARLGNELLPVWYYTSGMIKKTFASRFQVRKCQPVGLAIPPSYLNSAFERRGGALSKLVTVERKLSNVGWLSNVSDHYLIDLQLK